MGGLRNLSEMMNQQAVLRQPSVHEILESSQVKLARHLDATLTVSHKRANNRCLVGASRLPMVKVRKRKNEGVMRHRLLELLAVPPSEPKALAAGSSSQQHANHQHSKSGGPGRRPRNAG